MIAVGGSSLDEPSWTTPLLYTAGATFAADCQSNMASSQLVLVCQSLCVGSLTPCRALSTYASPRTALRHFKPVVKADVCSNLSLIFTAWVGATTDVKIVRNKGLLQYEAVKHLFEKSHGALVLRV